jgi:hypothetical protein
VIAGRDGSKSEPYNGVHTPFTAVTGWYKFFYNERLNGFRSNPATGSSAAEVKRTVAGKYSGWTILNLKPIEIGKE